MTKVGTITNIHIARIKDTPSQAAQQASVKSGQGLSGDRSCDPLNDRQVLIMDKEILDRLGCNLARLRKT